MSYVDDPEWEAEVMRRIEKDSISKDKRIRELEALVESAYREGFSNGHDGDFLSPYVDDTWRCSEAKKALGPPR